MPTAEGGHWFFRGVAKKPGYRRVANAWGLFHLALGGVLAFVVDIDFQDLAKSALLPLMAILVGLTFSWAGNVNSIMQTEEVQAFLREKGGPLEYVYTFQLCILIKHRRDMCLVRPASKLAVLAALQHACCGGGRNGGGAICFGIARYSDRLARGGRLQHVAAAKTQPKWQSAWRPRVSN